MSASASSISAAPRTYDPSDFPEEVDEIVPQGPRPTRAYGIIIDQACIRRRAKILLKEEGQDPAQMEPKELRKTIHDMMAFTLTTIPDDVYYEVPGLPRFRRNLILMNDSKGTYLLVFKDDSSYYAMQSHLDPEDVKKAKKFLGLQRQAAKWHNVVGAV
ncbi:hypothetical protein L226DRAFT_614340 [Lentinus tigrinus ALCF2SS1-7]|uniref:Uncharacterized protein n=1 Tax=Lentinus tigrinus ALCF2SS1-6 TaxID=1328759 RepID=A0A5C2S1G1_9APHY|nr:hypothetical protein L227DRAFT_602603 [Lentinus tigrinus ALCF2SS1-6]RPD73083.1 hypothetical protein L226DRAFT_614340 [Lentinus tigrinus ALCF2SS1-7]